MTEIYSITIEHPGLAEKVEEAMSEEMEEAKEKWKVFLSKKKEKRILDFSRLQLIEKVHSISKDTNWEIGEILSIYPVRPEKDSLLTKNIFLPEDAKKENLRLIEVNDGWKIDNDNSIDAIPLFQFEDYVIERILAWARTAVFYGVGSYKDMR